MASEEIFSQLGLWIVVFSTWNLLPPIWFLPADGGLAPGLEDEAAVQAGEVLTVESPPQAARILNLGTDFNSSPRWVSSIQ